MQHRRIPKRAKILYLARNLDKLAVLMTATNTGAINDLHLADIEAKYLKKC